MFKNLFNHIKNHKLGYSLGVAVVLVAGIFGYSGMTGSFSGQLGGAIRTLSPISFTVTRAACTSADWSCTAFEPKACPEQGYRTRTCTLVNTRCTNPELVKPAEREACEYVQTSLFLNYVASSSLLVNGERTLLSFSLTAGNTSSVDLKKFSFALTMKDKNLDGALGLKDFRLYRGSSLVASELIYADSLGGVGPGSAHVLHQSDTIGVNFTQTEKITAGSTQTYRLVATAVDVESGDNIITSLSSAGIDSNAKVSGTASHSLYNN